MQLLIKPAMVEAFTANFLRVIGIAIDAQFLFKTSQSYALKSSVSFALNLRVLWNVLIKPTMFGPMLSA